MKLNHLIAKLKCQKGQGAVEYSIAVIAVVLILIAVLLGPGNKNNSPLGQAVTSAFQKAANVVNTVPEN